MRVSHWTDFSPPSSQIDNFYGGVKGTPGIGYTDFNTPARIFAAVAYRLAVQPSHNGYHHFLGMYTSLQGVAFENACVKKDCRTGYHHICLNFAIPTYNFVKTQTNSGPQAPDAYQVNGAQWRENSYKSTFMYMGDIGASGSNSDAAATNYGLNSSWSGNTIGLDGVISTGRIQDLFVLRPTLVNSANKDDYIQLWDAGAYANNGSGGGQQMFFTGIPMAHPRFGLNSFTSTPGGQVGLVSTTWTTTGSNVTIAVDSKLDIDYGVTSLGLANGVGNTVISYTNVSNGNLQVAASLTGYPSDSSSFSTGSLTIAHTTGPLYLKFKFTGGPNDVTEATTVSVTNNSTTDTFTVTTITGTDI